MAMKTAFDRSKHKFKKTSIGKSNNSRRKDKTGVREKKGRP